MKSLCIQAQKNLNYFFAIEFMDYYLDVLRLWNKIWPDNDFLTYRGFVITMMKFIISSTETAPSWFVSAKRKIFAGIPRLDKILWNVSGRTGSSMQIKYAMASNNSTISVFSSVESSCSSLWFLEIEKHLILIPNERFT